jgi:(1->4)-alpha-D-glucan 1-alpha-D-glucosylmutase
VQDLLDYFQTLGISDLYLSPLLQARNGSRHGYDVIDPGHVNREIGTDQEFEQLAAALRERAMGILLDIVPNHMSATEANPWWRDLLEHGPASAFAGFFDIDWSVEPACGRLALPVLARSPEECVAAQELQLVVHQREVALTYFDRLLPIDAGSFPVLLAALQPCLPAPMPADLAQELEATAAAARELPLRSEVARGLARRQQARALHNRLADALQRLPAFQGITLAPERLLEVLEQQAYMPVYWVPGDRHINYRRFFDVSDLAGLRTEAREVFAAVHQRIIPWLSQGTITGVRVDHVDGLRDPADYLHRLHSTVAQTSRVRPYVVVEKVLLGDEQLPAEWTAAGTTGYDFLSLLNGLFVEPLGWKRLGQAWQQTTESADFTALLRDKKRQVLATLFPGELRSLVRRLGDLVPDAAPEALEFALTEMTACLPVYRTYMRSAPNETDYGVITEALEGARQRGADATLMDWLRGLLLEPGTAAQLDFIQRWQQLTGPVMAKGLEDTAFYHYHRLISSCEVGCDPRRPLSSIEYFHERMQRRHLDAPDSLNTTSTHDTKRSEDVRARVNVLSELASEWLDCVREWRTLHRRFRRRVQDLDVPDAGTEWLLYQTLAGAWPLAADPAFEQRIVDFMIKAAREAKLRTSWRAENVEYEAALRAFTSAVLARDNLPFRTRFLELQRRVAFYGALNSLSQLVLKLGAPGVPDFYQGCELWSLTLVDPDNRRPVDYEVRRAALLDADFDLGRARQHWRDGRLKALVTRKGLHVRNQYPALFARGQYLPRKIVGQRAGNAIAFERSQDGAAVLFLAARFYSQLCRPESWPTAQDWGDTELWSGEHATWQDAFTGRTLTIQDHIPLAAVLADLPVAILVRTS